MFSRPLVETDMWALASAASALPDPPGDDALLVLCFLI